MGHGKDYERLFANMQFQPTELTFSGLRGMWRKKGYGRMYTGLRRVKKRIKGVAKMEANEEAGRSYASGRNVREGKEEGEEPKRKKTKKARADNNPLTSSCKCGALDHQRVLPKSCPWKGLLKNEILKNYERRMKDVRAEEATATASACTVPTIDIVLPTGKSFRLALAMLT
jgi:hypothetical protein